MKTKILAPMLSVAILSGCAAPRPEYSHQPGKPSALMRIQTTTIKGWGMHKGTVYLGFEPVISKNTSPSETSTSGYYRIKGDAFGQDYVVPAGENLRFNLSFSKAGITKSYTCSAPFRFLPKPGKEYQIQFEFDNEDDNYSCEVELFDRAGDMNRPIGTVKEYATANGRMGYYRVDNAPLKEPQF
ncbi:hypothetical protein [Hydrogenophaga sp.]|uniref:hypothetical protein n=1 Tax=Hydrogenophaga sp. TaxID=1904254 RepID=UPI0035B19036